MSIPGDDSTLREEGLTRGTRDTPAMADCKQQERISILPMENPGRGGTDLFGLTRLGVRGYCHAIEDELQRHYDAE